MLFRLKLQKKTRTHLFKCHQFQNQLSLAAGGNPSLFPQRLNLLSRSSSKGEKKPLQIIFVRVLVRPRNARNSLLHLGNLKPIYIAEEMV